MAKGDRNHLARMVCISTERIRKLWPLHEMTSVTSYDGISVGSVCGIDEENYSSLRRFLRVT